MERVGRTWRVATREYIIEQESYQDERGGDDKMHRLGSRVIRVCFISNLFTGWLLKGIKVKNLDVITKKKFLLISRNQ